MSNYYLLLGQQQYVDTASQYLDLPTNCAGQESHQTTFNSYNEVTPNLIDRISELRNLFELNEDWNARISTFNCLSESTKLFNISVKPTNPTIPQLLFAKKAYKPAKSNKEEFIKFFRRINLYASVENVDLSIHAAESKSKLKQLERQLNALDLETVNIMLSDISEEEKDLKLDDIARRRKELEERRLDRDDELIQCLTSNQKTTVEESLNGMILPYPTFKRDPLVNLNFNVTAPPQDKKVKVTRDSIKNITNEEIKKILLFFLEDIHAKEISFTMLIDEKYQQFYFSKS